MATHLGSIRAQAIPNLEPGWSHVREPSEPQYVWGSSHLALEPQSLLQLLLPVLKRSGTRRNRAFKPQVALGLMVYRIYGSTKQDLEHRI
jgi:hypothetical protein